MGTNGTLQLHARLGCPRPLTHAHLAFLARSAAHSMCRLTRLVLALVLLASALPAPSWCATTSAPHIPNDALAPTAARRNVLFITVDDMRPNLGAFNFSLAHTPNLDRLAATGLTFKRAYVQYAFCAPSRNSFMSGASSPPQVFRLFSGYADCHDLVVGVSCGSMYPPSPPGCM